MRYFPNVNINYGIQIYKLSGQFILTTNLKMSNQLYKLLEFANKYNHSFEYEMIKLPCTLNVPSLRKRKIKTYIFEYKLHEIIEIRRKT